MANSFDSDNSKGGLGNGVNAIFLELDSGDIAEIFPTNLDVSIGCKFIGSPTERGMMEFDNKVTQPTVVTLTGTIKAACWSKLQKVVKEIWDRKPHKGTVHMKNDTVNNMMVEELREVSTPKSLDSIQVHIRLRQLLEEGMTAY